MIVCVFVCERGELLPVICQLLPWSMSGVNDETVQEHVGAKAAAAKRRSVGITAEMRNAALLS